MPDKANESAKHETAQSAADVAASKDGLALANYVGGLSQFIEECATPMTISIQGDWGTGKTSLFNLIDQKLRAENSGESGAATYGDNIIGVVKVNTWQYAVAGYRDDLIVVLIAEIISKLDPGNTTLKDQVTTVLRSGLNTFGRLVFSRLANGAELNSNTESKPEFEVLFDSCQEVGKLKEDLAKTVAARAENDGKSPNSRLVVFVDDLDRLEPEIAVNLMEGIKNFLDCAHCVFVLAIDEKVVFDGIRKKYGDELGEERKQMFFDKLIQVPFRIPTNAYNLNDYLRGLLGVEEEHATRFVQVIETLVRVRNPRSIKRYVNTMSLYRNILDASDTESAQSLAMLFAAIIMKVESRQGFNVVADCIRSEVDLEAVLDEVLDLEDGISWTNVPLLWKDGDGGKKDLSKWIRKLEQNEAPSLEGAYHRICSLASNRELDPSDHNGGTLFRPVGKSDKGGKALLVKLGQDGQKLTVTAYKELVSPDAWKNIHKQLKEKWGNQLKGEEGDGHITVIAGINDRDKLKDTLPVVNEYLSMCCQS